MRTRQYNIKVSSRNGVRVSAVDCKEKKEAIIYAIGMAEGLRFCDMLQECTITVTDDNENEIFKREYR